MRPVMKINRGQNIISDNNISDNQRDEKIAPNEISAPADLEKIDQDTLTLESIIQPIPYGFAKSNGLVFTGFDDGLAHIAMRENAPKTAILEVRRFLNHPLKILQVSQEEFDKHLSAQFAMDGGAAAMANTIDIGSDNLFSNDLPSAEDLLDSADDAPAIKLINGIIAEAARNGVSDVHIEPYENALIVRMRIDGQLEEKLRMPPHVAAVIVSRIKVMARLDIAERRIPQDGRISLTLGGKLLDIRVSTLPSRAAERVVLRILDKDNAGITLEELGISPKSEAVLRAALAQPNGILLVTGPTGSGKTTTLYAGLKQLNDGSRNILTIEDPVEYGVEGVGQTQVNAKVGLTFAAGLRAILRQDPDVVMIGEIRDRETADIAVQAALTGHLVLSTVHTNDSIGAITRLRDMNVEPFLLASTIRGVIAQRLVRLLCNHCKEAEIASDYSAKMLNIEQGATIYRAVGCDKCNRTGYQGRIGVFEAISIDKKMREMINSGADEGAMSDYAFAHESNLNESVAHHVIAGRTSLEEAVRIARHDTPQDIPVPIDENIDDSGINIMNENINA